MITGGRGCGHLPDRICDDCLGKVEVTSTEDGEELIVEHLLVNGTNDEIVRLRKQVEELKEDLRRLDKGMKVRKVYQQWPALDTFMKKHRSKG